MRVEERFAITEQALRPVDFHGGPWVIEAGSNIAEMLSAGTCAPDTTSMMYM